MSVNASKKKDERFWKKWWRSGAVGTIIDNSFIVDAKYWLKYARDPKKNNTDIWIESVRRCVREAGITLEFIGTSEAELEQLFVNYNIVEAKHWLEYARDPKKDSIDTWISSVRECAKRAGITLESIGTSETELEQLFINYNIAKAKYWLKYARDPKKNNTDIWIESVRRCVREAGITLEFIGTSEAELEQIVHI